MAGCRKPATKAQETVSCYDGARDRCRSERQGAKHASAQGMDDVMELAVSVANDSHRRACRRCNLQPEPALVVKGFAKRALRRRGIGRWCAQGLSRKRSVCC